MRNEGARPVGSAGNNEPGKCDSKCEGFEAEVCWNHAKMSRGQCGVCGRKVSGPFKDVGYN